MMRRDESHMLNDPFTSMFPTSHDRVYSVNEIPAQLLPIQHGPQAGDIHLIHSYIGTHHAILYTVPPNRCTIYT